MNAALTASSEEAAPLSELTTASPPALRAKRTAAPIDDEGEADGAQRLAAPIARERDRSRIEEQRERREDVAGGLQEL